MHAFAAKWDVSFFFFFGLNLALLDLALRGVTEVARAFQTTKRSFTGYHSKRCHHHYHRHHHIWDGDRASKQARKQAKR
ncbi:hypothetical protein F4778DRAFT_160251 [Xylariomycetidae sp. FL2044]|nr:hypothetical protein F4778DRAFT_160251 [Xylariomycetidae sp. FL2044]